VTKQAQSALRDLVAFAHVLADASGEAIRPYFRSALTVSNKAAGAAFDPVTAADEAAERVIAAAVAERWPDHGFIGEEHGETRPDARYRWVVDPIDGTRAFITGMPAWGTLVGLLRRGTACFGQMHQPFTRERFSGDCRTARYRGPTGDRRTHAAALEVLSRVA
jgi:myo-inositol-1(or 4)-monophosphatase